MIDNVGECLYHRLRTVFSIVDDLMAMPHKLADGRYECQNCLRKFTRNEYTFKEPKFCKDKCRKEFHANSGISLKKIETRVRQWVRDELVQAGAISK